MLGHPLRVEHWDTAIQHGKVVARNLLGEEAVHDALPYFFTDQYDLGMEYVGNPGPEGFDRVVVRGRTGGDDGGQFTAWWLRGDRVVAGMHVNDWDAIDHVRRIVGHRSDAEVLADNETPLSDVASAWSSTPDHDRRAGRNCGRPDRRVTSQVRVSRLPAVRLHSDEETHVCVARAAPGGRPDGWPDPWPPERSS